MILPLPPAPTTAYQQRHAAALRFGWRMRCKLQQNELLAAAIREHLETVFDVALPLAKKEFRDRKAEILRFDAYGEALEEELGPLIRLYYALRQTFGTYAEFGGAGTRGRRLVPLTFFYSRHRLDYAWNLRKSQLVRSRYFEYLAEARDERGRKLTDFYLPIHLTLTAPHKGGLWLGQRFYARQLIKMFAQLRKTDAWKKYVYAGEYGLEVKRSKAHGLHIHIHSFLLQHPQFSRNEASDALVAEWKALMANTTRYSGMHYETLFSWKRDAEGKSIKDANGQRIKQYITPGQSELKEYLAGVMECIKYHFKPDCLDKLEQPGAGFDLPLIKEILANTQGLRMYSRFGAFYKQPLLNFNKLHDERTADELSTEELEDEVKATADGVEERIVDPRTMRPAQEGSYRLKVGHPLHLKYHGGYTGSKASYAREPFESERADAVLLTAPPGLNLKQVIRLHLCGMLAKYCDPLSKEIGTPPEWATNKTLKKRPNRSG